MIDRDTVQLSVTDAMGHGVEAALLATLAVGALRPARRAGGDLAEQARQADQAMREHGHKGYVTGQLLRISLLDGKTEFINAGHPWPLRMRNGQVREIAPKIDLPFGFPARHSYRVQSLDLWPGDRLVMLTDGMMGRNGNALDLADLIVRTLVAAITGELRRLVIRYANRAYLQVTGRTSEELVGRSIMEAFPDTPAAPAAARRLGASLQRVLASRGPDVVAPLRSDIPVAGRSGALVLAVKAVREDHDGAAAWWRQRLDVAGTVWLVFDGGLGRLPLACRRCRARTGHRLTADSAAGLATLRCTAGHITSDPRLSPDTIVEAIGHHGGHASADLDLRGVSTL